MNGPLIKYEIQCLAPIRPNGDMVEILGYSAVAECYDVRYLTGDKIGEKGFIRARNLILNKVRLPTLEDAILYFKMDPENVTLTTLLYPNPNPNPPIECIIL